MTVFRLVALRYQASEQGDDEVDRTEMTRVLTLQNGFQSVDDSLDDRSLAGEKFLGERQQLIDQMPFALRD